MTIREDHESTFATLLRAYRERESCGLQELADELGVTRQTVSAWERGVYLPRTLEEVLHLAGILRTSEGEVDLLAAAAGYKSQIKVLRSKRGVKGEVKNLIFASTAEVVER